MMLLVGSKSFAPLLGNEDVRIGASNCFLRGAVLNANLLFLSNPVKILPAASTNAEDGIKM